MEEAILRGWVNLFARLDGPMHIRFILQPTMAVLLALRAGVRDARAGELPFLEALWRAPAHRRARLQKAWRDVRNVFLIAVVLDCTYQLRVHQGVYLLELVITATLLAVVPYGVARGPARRLARRWLALRERRHLRVR